MDKELRKALTKLGIYMIWIISVRWLYFSRDFLVYGFLTCRHDYRKELLRIYFKYRWLSETKLIELLLLTENTSMGVLKRCCKPLKDMVSQNQFMELSATLKLTKM